MIKSNFRGSARLCTRPARLLFIFLTKKDFRDIALSGKVLVYLSLLNAFENTNKSNSLLRRSSSENESALFSPCPK